MAEDQSRTLDNIGIAVSSSPQNNSQQAFKTIQVLVDLSIDAVCSTAKLLADFQSEQIAEFSLGANLLC